MGPSANQLEGGDCHSNGNHNNSGLCQPPNNFTQTMLGAMNLGNNNSNNNNANNISNFIAGGAGGVTSIFNNPAPNMNSANPASGLGMIQTSACNTYGGGSGNCGGGTAGITSSAGVNLVPPQQQSSLGHIPAGTIIYTINDQGQLVQVQNAGPPPLPPFPPPLPLSSSSSNPPLASSSASSSNDLGASGINNLNILSGFGQPNTATPLQVQQQGSQAHFLSTAPPAVVSVHGQPGGGPIILPPGATNPLQSQMLSSGPLIFPQHQQQQVSVKF